MAVHRSFQKRNLTCADHRSHDCDVGGTRSCLRLADTFRDREILAGGSRLTSFRYRLFRYLEVRASFTLRSSPVICFGFCKPRSPSIVGATSLNEPPPRSLPP